MKNYKLEKNNNYNGKKTIIQGIKKVASIVLLTGALILSGVSCDMVKEVVVTNTPEPTEVVTETPIPTPTPIVEETPSPTSTPIAEETPSPTPTPIPRKDYGIATEYDDLEFGSEEKRKIGVLICEIDGEKKIIYHIIVRDYYGDGEKDYVRYYIDYFSKAPILEMVTLEDGNYTLEPICALKGCEYKSITSFSWDSKIYDYVVGYPIPNTIKTNKDLREFYEDTAKNKTIAIKAVPIGTTIDDWNRKYSRNSDYHYSS